jgi:hypothetical protein
VIKALKADFRKLNIRKLGIYTPSNLPQMTCDKDGVNVIVLKDENDKYCIMGFAQA